MKPRQARYSLCSITTKKVELLEKRDRLKVMGYTDEDIYERGVKEISADHIENLSQNNVS